MASNSFSISLLAFLYVSGDTILPIKKEKKKTSSGTNDVISTMFMCFLSCVVQFCGLLRQLTVDLRKYVFYLTEVIVNGIKNLADVVAKCDDFSYEQKVVALFCSTKTNNAF